MQKMHRPRLDGFAAILVCSLNARVIVVDD